MNQHSFSGALRDVDLKTPRGVIAPGGRFNVHRNTYVSSLVAALEKTFPVIQRLVGSDFFAAIAAEFIEATPPKSKVMSDYGDGFPSFLESFGPLREIPYLGDVARIEFARVQAYHAADAPLIEASSESEVAQSIHAQVSPHPSMTLIRSRHPAYSIWEENRKEFVSEVQVWAPEDVLVCRTGTAISTQKIDSNATAFIRSLCAAGSAEAAIQSVDGDVNAALMITNFIRVARLGAFALAQ